MRIRKTAVAGFVVLGLLSSLRAEATAPSSHRVSGPSPFPAEGCGHTDEPVYATAGGSASGAEVDLSVAVNPLDDKHIVAAWVQDAGLGFVAATTRDGGETWSRAAVPGLTVCSGGPHARILHARLSFGPDGRVWLAGEALEGFFPDPRSGLNPIPVVTSVDGGTTWSAPSYVNKVPAMNGFNVIAAEPDTPGAAVVVWHVPEPATTTYVARSTDGGATWVSRPVPGYASNAPDTLPESRIIPAPDGSWHLLRVEDTLRGLAGVEALALVHRRSTDKGLTWSTPVVLDESVRPQWVSGGVGPDGTVSVGWLDDGGEMVVSSSTDDGATWSSAVVAATGLTAPDPSMAVAPTGDLAIAFTTTVGVAEGMAQQMLSRSSDGGSTWTVSALDEPFPTPGEVYGVFGGADGGMVDGPYELGYYQTTAAGPTGQFVSIHQRGGADVDGPSDAYVTITD